MPATLDHIVLAAPDLAAGVDEFTSLTGVFPAFGGRHEGRGSANFLVGLRAADAHADEHPQIYLEIIGPDPEQRHHGSAPLPLDAHLATELRVQTWAARPTDLDITVRRAHMTDVNVGAVIEGSRRTDDGTLVRWRSTQAGGRLPAGGTQPFLIDWQDSPHPSQSDLPVLTLETFAVVSPVPDATEATFEALQISDVPVFEGDQFGFRLVLQGPNGFVRLGL